jgi:EF-P beta-lysylation protein EpmB
MRQSYRSPRELGDILQLPAELVDEAERSLRGFPLFAPLPFVARMRKADPRDPLLLQVWPQKGECDDPPGYTTDPVNDVRFERVPGVIHKYTGRALLIVSGTCAVHCRYCFRRHFPYAQRPQGWQQWESVLAALSEDHSLKELILSGGDPLTLRDELLCQIIDYLSKSVHLRRLRIHTRLPVVLPQRVTRAFLESLSRCRLSTVVVLHINHAQEIDEAVAHTIHQMQQEGVLVLNQAVLLRGVNDDADALVELCERLIDLRVLPYYLHQLDRVAGASHFEVELERGLRLMMNLRERLPGYAVPRYVCDEGNGHSKRILA